MYEYITGSLSELTPTYAVVETGGIGYFLHISLNTFSKCDGAESVKLYLHHVVREDAQLLYGFYTKSEREIFQHLISVSGVGVGTARMVLSTYTPSELRSIISTDNAALLKSVKGLGIKTAQKIILELRDKMMKLTPESDGEVIAVANSATQQEAQEALVMLGFSKASCKKAIEDVIKSAPNSSVEELIRQALKRL